MYGAEVDMIKAALHAEARICLTPGYRNAVKTLSAKIDRLDIKRDYILSSMG